MSLLRFILAGIVEETALAADASRVQQDQDCLRRYLAGDENGFLELYDRYKQSLFHYLYTFVRDQESAEDLVQDVFMELLKYAHKFDFRYSPATLLFRIARNRALNLKRSADYRRKTTVDKDYLESFGAQSSSQEQQLLHKEFREHMDRALDKLKPEVRAVFLLRLEQGMQYEDIASSLDVSSRTAKRYQEQALERIHKELQQAGFSLEALL